MGKFVHYHRFLFDRGVFGTSGVCLRKLPDWFNKILFHFLFGIEFLGVHDANFFGLITEMLRSFKHRIGQKGWIHGVLFEFGLFFIFLLWFTVKIFTTCCLESCVFSVIKMFFFCIENQMILVAMKYIIHAIFCRFCTRYRIFTEKANSTLIFAVVACIHSFNACASALASIAHVFCAQITLGTH